MKRLSKREIRKLSERIGVAIKEKAIYVEEFDNVKLYLFGEEMIPKLAEVSGELIPTFYFKELIESLPKVIVDQGAARALLRGADLMAPGVKERPEVEEGSLVLVLDTEGKPVGIGKALVSKLPEKGKVVKMLHVMREKDKVVKAIKERRSRKL